MSRFDLDQEITSTDVHVDDRVHTTLSHLQNTSPDIPAWTPQNIGNGLPSARMVLSMSVLEEWVNVADDDVNGFNTGYIISPVSFEDVTELLVPELRKRGLYDALPGRTLREKIYGEGQRTLRDDHAGSQYKYDVYHGK